ncbi:MAG: polymer-forming cytoskeletal protein, partial [Gammaproteobacteria bacterium]|nr:polymer-forming cytoskeletal protein [Gammaproteobacteria bacterium]
MAKNFRRFMDSASESTTLLGEGTRFIGKFSGRGHFVVCGEVEGDCELEGSRTIAVDGRWNGTIRAENVVIAGQVHGEVQASGQLEVAASARVTGSLAGTSIAIAEGAIIEGGVNVSGLSD